jgi:hypothetical protein
MRRGIAATLVLGVVLLIPVITAEATTERVDGYVGGAVTGKGREFGVGDGLRIVFHDRTGARTRYTVCWKGPHHDIRCWHRTTGKAGRASAIGTVAPEHLGRYNVTWRVNRRAVAHWWFENGLGD